MDTTFFETPWLLAFVAAILALHVATYFLPKLHLPLTIVNVLLHTAFCAVLLISGGTLYEFVLVLLISTCLSMFLGKLEEDKKLKETKEAEEIQK